MTFRRTVLISSIALLAASCGSGEESDATLPQITLITTTSEVMFESVDTGPVSTGDPDATDVSIASTETDSVSTDLGTTVDPESTLPTSTAAPEATTTEIATTTTVDPGEGRFALLTDGLGSTSFGADPEGTIAFISNFLGQPTGDTGWQDAFNFGACGGAELRQVNWGNLQLEFGDASDITQGRRHFYAFSYGLEGSSSAVPSGLETSEGITVGSSVGALLAAYPNILLLQGDEFIADNFVINDNLRGRLSGLTDNDTVQMIIGGLPCEG